MRRLRPLRGLLAALALAATAGSSALAQSDGGAGDSTAAPADSTAGADSSGADAADSAAADSAAAGDSTGTARPLISTDGAVSLFEEAVPGEGIEGFWWEYDPYADLARLLDKDLRADRLEPILDPFGFQIAIPETILALRDSVSAVADSILAERIDVSVNFAPKLTSSYNEQKDLYVLKNSFDTAYPISRQANVNVNIANDNEYNRSTGKVKDDRRVGTTLNYQITDGIVSTANLNWTQGNQERNGVTDANNEAIRGGGQIRDKRGVGALGQLETSVGLQLARQDYSTANSTGQSHQLTPDWKARLSRSYPGGSATLDYSGNVGRSDREEIRTLTLFDSTGAPRDSTVVDTSEDSNSNNKFDLGANYVVAAGTDLKFTGSSSKDTFQYLSQVDSLAGRQETRTRESQNASLVLTSKPATALEIRARANYRVNDTTYDLERIRSTGSTTRDADSEIKYTAWEGGRWTFKMQRSAERRDFQTAQAGDVTKQEASADYKQSVTDNVDFEAAYLITLDRYEFDDKEENTGDRDLRTQRTTFRVRYNPVPTVTSSVRMEIRTTESINISPLKSGDNSTDYVYLMSPQYTWKLGAANFSGDFSADARYKVQDFRDDLNTLNRRFSFRQKWQQAFSRRFSTEVQYRWEFSDQGSYNRSETDGRRRYVRGGETRRSTFETKLRYEIASGVTSRVEYRQDRDRNYRISSGEKTLTNELPRRQFTYAVDFRKPILEHVRADVSFAQTFKGGRNVSDLEKNFYSIRAQIVYEPFKEKK